MRLEGMPGFPVTRRGFLALLGAVMLPDLPTQFDTNRTRSQHITDHERLHQRLQTAVYSADYASLQEALDDAVTYHRTLVIEGGVHTIRQPLVLPTGYNLIVQGTGGKQNTIIECASGDVLTHGAGYVAGVVVRDVTLRAMAGSGGAVMAGHYARCLFENVMFHQQNAGQPIIDHDSRVSGAGFIGNVFHHCLMYAHEFTTVPAVRLVGNDTINGNRWADCWCHYSSDWFFDLHGVHASAYSAGNRFEGLFFEITNGGNIRLRGCANTRIEGCMTYDTFLKGDITKALYSIEAGAGGLKSAQTLLAGNYRDASPRGAIAPDIYNAGLNTTLIGNSGPADFAVVHDAASVVSAVSLNNGALA